VLKRELPLSKAKIPLLQCCAAISAIAELLLDHLVVFTIATIDDRKRVSLQSDINRMVPTSVTLNSVTAIILRYFTEFDSFGGRLCYSGWDKTYNVCRIPSSTFGKIWPTHQSHGLSTTAELLVIFRLSHNTRVP